MSNPSKFTRRAFLGLAPAALVAGLVFSRDGSAASFETLSPPLPTEVQAGKIEVLEFFSFACPHCAELDPLFESWIKKQGKDVVVRRVPVTFRREAWRGLAQLYYTLEAMGLSEQLTPKVFRAIHEENKDLVDEKVRAAWLTANGVDMNKFQTTYKSFTVQSRTARSDQLVTSFRISGVPTLVVGGKYVTSGTLAGSLPAALSTLDELVAKVRKEQGRK